MEYPDVLGLFVRARAVLVLHANEIRVSLPCDSEIDLILVDCFPSPRVTADEAGRARLVPEGMRAYHATLDAINAAPHWLRIWIPVPKYDREWFPNLAPNSKQLGHLWITRSTTLNEHLVAGGHASRDQPKPNCSNFDGNPMV